MRIELSDLKDDDNHQLINKYIKKCTEDINKYIQENPQASDDEIAGKILSDLNRYNNHFERNSIDISHWNIFLFFVVFALFDLKPNLCLKVIQGCKNLPCNPPILINMYQIEIVIYTLQKQNDAAINTYKKILKFKQENKDYFDKCNKKVNNDKINQYQTLFTAAKSYHRRDLPAKTATEQNNGEEKSDREIAKDLYQEVLEYCVKKPVEKVPTKLFCFRPLNQNTITELIMEQIYLANPSDWNDPFDCNIGDKDESLKEVFKNFRAKCFVSGENELKNILMWSHYGDSHKGICIEYEYTPQERAESIGLHVIKYQDTIKMQELDDFFKIKA